MAPPAIESSSRARYGTNPQDFSIGAASDFALCACYVNDVNTDQNPTATLEGAAMVRHHVSVDGYRVCHTFGKVAPATGAGTTFDVTGITDTSFPTFHFGLSGVHQTTPITDSDSLYQDNGETGMTRTLDSSVNNIIVGWFMMEAASGLTISASNGCTIISQSVDDNVLTALFYKNGTGATDTVGYTFDQGAHFNVHTIHAFSVASAAGSSTPFLTVRMKLRGT